MQYNIPILIIAFNRPDVSIKTFEIIKKFQPTFLYVAVDAARKSLPDEKEKVEAVKKIYQDINWPCNIKYKFNSINQGAEITVSSAVSWVLEEHEYCIILEDDILASNAFFNFAKEMLIRYKNADQIYMVSGAQFTPMETMKADYTYSLYGHTGFGWATWRRAWKHFNMDFNDCDNVLQDKELHSMFPCGSAYKSFIKSIRKIMAKGSENCTWDSCWSYIRFRDHALSIVPKFNLTQNIGVYGLHAHGLQNYHKIGSHDNFVVRNHPSIIELDKIYDRYHYKHYLHHSFFTLLMNKIKSMI